MSSDFKEYEEPCRRAWLSEFRETLEGQELVLFDACTHGDLMEIPDARVEALVGLANRTIRARSVSDE